MAYLLRLHENPLPKPDDDDPFPDDDDPADGAGVTFRELVESCREPLPPRHATDAPPGSEAKIRVFQSRIDAGEGVFHPDDLSLDQIHAGQGVEVGRNGRARRLEFQTRSEKAA